MSRSWFGLALLILLLAGGLAATWYMGSCHSQGAEILEAAGSSALAGDWEQANALAARAMENWERGWTISAAFADHGPMEAIDSQFAQLEVYAAARERLSFAALCAQISRQLEAIGEEHAFNWRNLL